MAFIKTENDLHTSYIRWKLCHLRRAIEKILFMDYSPIENMYSICAVLMFPWYEVMAPINIDGHEHK